MYYRYVDATVVLQQNNVCALHEALIAAHPAIYFTCEKEIDGELLFLDALVSRGRGVQLRQRFIASPAAAGLCYTLILITLRNTKELLCVLCCHGGMLCHQMSNDPHRNSKTLSLLCITVPRAFIDDTRRRMQKGYNQTTEMPTSFVSIPFVRMVSEDIRRALKPLDVRTVSQP
ncbi:hypothetical protein HPB48_009664 [Haemaphysalis longicornis]|uniref:Uncharacterized protein n=1 Tax=Haemaphysalis longicornis TaxID=44386 RepID=A0A9J6FDR3_HAELO|nr:hypothetical protein HPB48_009664 [Haemaphysalis longicornis]